MAEKIYLVHAKFGAGKVPLKGFASVSAAESCRDELRDYQQKIPAAPAVDATAEEVFGYQSEMTEFLNGHPLPPALRMADGFEVSPLDFVP